MKITRRPLLDIWSIVRFIIIIINFFLACRYSNGIVSDRMRPYVHTYRRRFERLDHDIYTAGIFVFAFAHRSYHLSPKRISFNVDSCHRALIYERI